MTYPLNSSPNLSLSTDDFQKLSALIQTNLGIKMPEGKKTMLESRLQKRLRALNINSFQKYCSYLFSDTGIRDELTQLYDVITTNKTEFFRESSHFDYLTHTAIPSLLSGRRKNTLLNIWSAGCATGEEPYTLAIVLNELKGTIPELNYDIVASDISIKVLEKAKLAVYQEDQTVMISDYLKKKYFLRSKDRSKNLVRIIPSLRNIINFRRINLMDEKFPLNYKMHIIFCRNVLIYFDRSIQEVLLRKFSQYLKPGGYLFLGHSETLCGMSIPMVSVAPNVYKLFY